MQIDIKRAFSYPFAEPQWPQKIIIGGLFFLAAMIAGIFINFFFINYVLSQLGINLSNTEKTYVESIANYLISIPILIIPFGFVVQAAHNEINNKTPLLPEWKGNIQFYLKLGLKYYLINFIYILIIFVIALILGLLAGIILQITDNMGIVDNLSIIIAITVGLLFGLINPFITTAFARDFKVKEALRFWEILSLIRKVLPEYAVSVLILLGLWLIWIISYFALICTCVGAVIPRFLTFIVHLISINLFAQTYKLSLER